MVRMTAAASDKESVLQWEKAQGRGMALTTATVLGMVKAHEWDQKWELVMGPAMGLVTGAATATVSDQDSALQWALE